MKLLSYYFTPTETARKHPIPNHWAVECDVATTIKSIGRIKPFQSEHKSGSSSSLMLNRDSGCCSYENRDHLTRIIINGSGGPRPTVDQQMETASTPVPTCVPVTQQISKVLVQYVQSVS